SDRIRLSVDYRYQPLADPVCVGLSLHCYGDIPDVSVLTRGWSTRRWIDPPLGTRRVPFQGPRGSVDSWHAELDGPQSRLLTVSAKRSKVRPHYVHYS